MLSNQTLPQLYQLTSQGSLTRRQMLTILERYYFSNSLYFDVSKNLKAFGYWEDGIKPLGNPTFRAIEFLVTHVWKAGFSYILTDNDRILEPLDQLYKWSNWTMNSSFCVRRSALFGDIFIRVYTKNVNVDGKTPKVVIAALDPLDVTEVRHDNSGNLIYCRVDIVSINDDGEEQIHTEVWRRNDLSLRIWRYPVSEGFKELDQIGKPDEEYNLMDAFGIDFIPIAHTPLFDIGGDYGMSAIWPALDKIDELNRMLTTLNNRVFRYGKPTNAITQELKDDARPTAPIQIVKSALSALGSTPYDYDGERIVTLPPNSQIEQLIPNLPYGDILAIAKSLQDEIVNDLPELRHGQLVQEGRELSGKAIATLLSDAVNKVLALRASFDDCLIRANKMALTIGQHVGIWRDIGEYERDELEHTFADRPVFEMSAYEKAELTRLRVDSGVPLVLAAKWEGLSQSQLDELAAAIEQQKASEMISFSDALSRARDDASRAGSLA